MARSLTRLAVLCCFITFFNALHVSSENIPEIDSLKVISITDSIENADYNKVLFEVQGKNLPSSSEIKTTDLVAQKYNLCERVSDYQVRDVNTISRNSSQYFILVPKSVHGNLYLCLARKKRGNASLNILGSGYYDWLHEGPTVFIPVPRSQNAGNFHHEEDFRLRREQKTDEIRVLGLRLEATYKSPEIDENGVPDVLSTAEHTLRLFGYNFIDNMTVTFTPEPADFGKPCQLPVAKGFNTAKLEYGVTDTTSVVIKIPALPADAETYYICIKPGDFSSDIPYTHQGKEYWLQIKSHDRLMPVWASIVIICLCLAFSSLFSGLNLGLMSLDRTELKILCNTGTSKERRYAKAIQPVRNHGNYLLCSILLGNVFVNSIFTIMLDDLTSGLIAVVFSTIAIVLFGEITPQAVCSRHGLAIGAKTIYITKVVMILTFPLSYPTSKFLDWLLGEEIGSVYNRERLKELVKVTTGENDLDKDEVNIISGALELRKKTVSDVMTRIEDVFMLDYEAILDFETISEVMKSGFSRVPVFEGNRQNIVTVLYIKDLAFVDPDDNTPLKTLCQFYQNPCNFVFEDVTLDIMFKIFKEGNKGHMAFVHRVNNEGEGDPFYETIGLITLEDVIEELIQAEIMDETDVFTDNRSKRKRAERVKQDFSMFAERRGESSRIRMSPQLTLAAYQYLSTSVEPFLPNIISETILRRLLKQDIVYHIKKNKEWRSDPACLIYQQGRAADYFVLILEGRVEVTVGRENLVFEGGPFTYFGTQALIQNIGVGSNSVESPSVPPSALGSLESLNLDAMLRHTFMPDYSVRGGSNSDVLYVQIKRSLYLAAKRASLMERSQRDNTQAGEQFDEEVDKLLHSLRDDGSIGHRTPRKGSSTKNPAQHDSSGHSDNTSPKTPSLYSNKSPPHKYSPRDANGSIKSSPDDLSTHGKEEELSLLPRKS